MITLTRIILVTLGFALLIHASFMAGAIHEQGERTAPAGFILCDTTQIMPRIDCIACPNCKIKIYLYNENKFKEKSKEAKADTCWHRY